MKNAKEMFEELDYIDFNEDESKIVYSKSFKLRLKEIKFDKMFKTIIVKGGSGEWATGIITYNELIAINQMIEELNWK